MGGHDVLEYDIICFHHLSMEQQYLTEAHRITNYHVMVVAL